MTLTEILAAIEIKPDSCGRFQLPWPLRHPQDGPAAAAVLRFRLTAGRLFDGFNRPWAEADFTLALRNAGHFPVLPTGDGSHCAQCGGPLAGKATRFCGAACKTVWKREAMRRRRGFKPHVHVCWECGKAFHVGRPHKAAQSM